MRTFIKILFTACILLFLAQVALGFIDHSVLITVHYWVDLVLSAIYGGMYYLYLKGEL